MRFSYQEFVDWLARKAPDAVVGYSRMTRCCPVAQCLTELNPGWRGNAAGSSLFMVNPDLFPECGNEQRLMEPWEVAYIDRLDRMFAFKTPITAEEARTALVAISISHPVAQP